MAGLSGDLKVGDKIKWVDGTGDGRGGAFNGTVLTGLDAGETFESFCLEYKEGIDFSSSGYYVGGITSHTVGNPNVYSGANFGGSQDPISAQTVWLFTQFYTTHLTDTSVWGTGNQVVKNTALQQAIWSFEQESFGNLSDLAASYKTLANTAADDGWGGNSNVRVLNMYSQYNANTQTFSGYRQDQLVMVSSVPEPESLALLLAGLGVVGAVARRRKARAA